jgi:phosphopantothenoylcysteine decarboxylase/phosphopantothenate--cysteine ligase
MKSQHVLIGVSGGIAAVKIPLLIGSLKRDDISIDVIETSSATHILPPAVISDVLGKPVYTHMYPPDFDPHAVLAARQVEHISLARNTSLFVIVPATANIIAKLAGGIADDYLTTTALAVTCPVLICPSMNTNMWKHPATQENVQKLRSLGYHVFPPDCGDLACGDIGEGRLPDIDAIAHEVRLLLHQTRSLAGKRVLVTTGGTTETIDSVRTISNRSSGKMGIAIAEACFLAGATVTILRSTSSVSSRYGIQEFTFETALDLETLMNKHIPETDICFHVAAVSDFSVKNPKEGKHSSTTPVTLELEPRKKLLDEIKGMNPTVFLVAFKAEYGLENSKLVSVAAHRMEECEADLIIANDVGRIGVGFQSDNNEVIVISKNGKIDILSRASKTEIARQIVSKLPSLME